jgi:hypothetical protein
MSASLTGPFTLRMIDREVSSMNSTRTWVTPPLDPVRPRTLVTLANLTGCLAESYTSRVQVKRNRVVSELPSSITEKRRDVPFLRVEVCVVVERKIKVWILCDQLKLRQKIPTCSHDHRLNPIKQLHSSVRSSRLLVLLPRFSLKSHIVAYNASSSLQAHQHRPGAHYIPFV